MESYDTNAFMSGFFPLAWCKTLCCRVCQHFISPHGLVILCCANTPPLLICSLVVCSLGCVHFLTIMHNAALNTREHALSVLWVILPGLRVEVVGPACLHVFVLEELPNCFPKGLLLFTLWITLYEGSDQSASLPALIFVHPFYIAILVSVWKGLRIIFLCMSLMLRRVFFFKNCLWFC